MSVSVHIYVMGPGEVRQHSGSGYVVIADADNIPDLRLEVWDLFHEGKISREEREQLHDEIDAECGL